MSWFNPNQAGLFTVDGGGGTLYPLLCKIFNIGVNKVILNSTNNVWSKIHVHFKMFMSGYVICPSPGRVKLNLDTITVG